MPPGCVTTTTGQRIPSCGQSTIPASIMLISAGLSMRCSGAMASIRGGSFGSQIRAMMSRPGSRRWLAEYATAGAKSYAGMGWFGFKRRGRESRRHPPPPSSPVKFNAIACESFKHDIYALRTTQYCGIAHLLGEGIAHQDGILSFRAGR
jgi:hypothetical protein